MKQILWFILFILFAASSYTQDSTSVSYMLNYDIVSEGTTNKFTFTTLIPSDLPNIQKVEEIKYSPEPDSVISKNDNIYAFFTLENLDENKQSLRIEVDMISYETDFEISKQRSFESENVDQDRYLNAEKWIEVEDKSIRKLASSLKGENDISTIDNIYKYLNENLGYAGYLSDMKGAAKALESKSGDCTEFSDLFVALSRSNNIPARVISGMLTSYTNTPFHSWVEVFLSDYGWVRIDPTTGNSNGFSDLQNRYIQLSSIRNDPKLNNYHRWSYRYWGDKVKLKETFMVLP